MNRPRFLAAFNFVSGIASILSLFLYFLNVKWGAYFALIFFVFFLLSVLLLLWWAIHGMLRKEDQYEYKKLSAFSFYDTVDGVKGVYESFRVIQSKRLCLRFVDWNFKWSGSKRPVLSSSLQRVDGKVIDGGQEYDKVRLAFNRPLAFNETETVHFRAEVDDVDGMAGPYSAYRVDSPINLVHFRITLRHKSQEFNRPAFIQRKLIESQYSVDYTNVCTVPFDKETKSYHYDLLNPEVGYFYRILWEK